MRKPLEVWQFIIALVTLIMSAGTLIVNLSNKVVDQGARISALERSTTEITRQFEKVNEKNIEEIMDETKVEVMNHLRQTIRPEFLNRVDEIIL